MMATFEKQVEVVLDNNTLNNSPLRMQVINAGIKKSYKKKEE